MANPTVIIAGSFVYPDVPFLEMDVTVEVRSNFTSNISEHPVERGADISDHVRVQNPTFSLKGYVSNHHVLPVAEGNVVSDYGKRTSIVYDYLDSMWRSSAVFTLVNEFKSYPNCVIKEINIPQDAANSEAIEINLEIQQLRLVSPEYLLASVSVASDKKGDSEGTKSGGTASTSEIDTGAPGIARITRVLSGENRDIGDGTGG